MFHSGHVEARNVQCSGSQLDWGWGRWSTARILPWVLKHFRSSAYGDQSIHAKIIITFVFLKHTITRASMPTS